MSIWPFKNTRTATAGSLNEKGDRTVARSPESTHMNDTVKAFAPQDPLHFIREGFVTFTPAQAGMIMRSCIYDRQRGIDKLHVETLREVMRRDGWAAKDKLDFAQLPDGRLILVNGNHRMTAQTGQPRNIEWTVVIHPCDTMEQVHQLYFKFDTNLRKRSENNILQGVGFAESYGLKATTAQALYRAAPIIASGLVVGHVHLRGGNISDLAVQRIVDVRLQFAAKYAAEAKMIEEWMVSADKRIKSKMKSGGFFAVALVTAKHQPEVAERFWSGLFENDRLARGDARSTLHADMLTRDYKHGIMQQSVIVPGKAWSAFYSGRQLKIIKVQAGQRLRIEGTPFTVVA